MDDAAEAEAAKPRRVIQGTPFGLYFADSDPAQRPSDVGVVIPTVLRPELTRALESVYAQDLDGRIQIAIGIDKSETTLDALLARIARRPPNVSVLVLRLPYSTSSRHGGVHTARDGGALRSILTFMINSRYVAYLDDDNLYRPNHLSALLEAIKGKAWAATHRMLLDVETGAELGKDIWDSVGPGKGRIEGGFVDPNCLMVDKVKLAEMIGAWSSRPARQTKSAPGDRNFFRRIREAPHVVLDQASVLYYVRRTNLLHRFIASNRPAFT